MDLKVSGDYSDQLREWLPALVEDRLLAEGWTLVVRGQRMRHIQEERSLPGIKPETRLPDNELLGATAFVELVARVQVKEIQSIVGYRMFGIGDIVRAFVDLNGQIVDPATGVLKSSINVSGSARGLKTALVVTLGRDWRIGAGGYNLKGIRESLVGKAADEAAVELVEKLKSLYPSIPPRVSRVQNPLQPASTTIALVPAPATILIELPGSHSAAVGDRYGVYRGDQVVAQVEIIRLAGNRAEARILSQTGAIEPTDIARPLDRPQPPVIIKAE
mgnify:CR=1 FL=1